MQHYVALIHKDADSDYGVSFPDFPGAITAGRTLDEARAMAEEALSFHIQGMVEDGEPVPEPSSLEAIMTDPEYRDGVAILVSVAAQTIKAVRINITVQEDVLREIDAYAEAHGLTRSGFLASAAKTAIERGPT
jgi:predicted RNase H-like HicB family nuclease